MKIARKTVQRHYFHVLGKSMVLIFSSIQKIRKKKLAIYSKVYVSLLRLQETLISKMQPGFLSSLGTHQI